MIRRTPDGKLAGPWHTILVALIYLGTIGVLLGELLRHLFFESGL